MELWKKDWEAGLAHAAAARKARWRGRKGRNGRSVAAIGQTQLEVQSQGPQMVETAAQLTLSGSEERGEWNLKKREIESNHHIEKHLF